MDTKDKEPTYSCSGGVSKIYKKYLHRQVPFEHCCDEHDARYAENGWPWRKYYADWKFYTCIKKTGRTWKGLLCFLGVSTIFGWFAWFKCSYQKLSKK